MNEYITDEQGKWLIQGSYRMLIEPSQAYIDKANEHILNPTIVEEKVDDEKVAMAEAIIMLETKNTELEGRIMELENKNTGGTI